MRLSSAAASLRRQAAMNTAYREPRDRRRALAPTASLSRACAKAAPAAIAGRVALCRHEQHIGLLRRGLALPIQAIALAPRYSATPSMISLWLSRRNRNSPPVN
jgi:hypothetical protein